MMIILGIVGIVFAVVIIGKKPNVVLVGVFFHNVLFLSSNGMFIVVS